MKILLSVILIFFSYSIVSVTICQQNSYTANITTGTNRLSSASFQEKLLDSLNESKSRIKFKLTLMKNEYKKFEPILANCEIINFSKDTIKMYSEFDEQLGEMNIYAKDKFGNVYNDNKMNQYFTRSFNISGSNISLYPNDTLKIAMRVNNWGKQVELFDMVDKILVPKTDNDSYFGLTGYYPEGEYTLYIELPEVSGVLSNEVSFRINELTNEDFAFLKMTQANKFSDLAEMYPNSPFIEHVIAQQIMYFVKKTSLGKLTEEDKTKIYNLYTKLFNTNSNSNYIYLQNFVYPLVKILDTSEQSVNKVINNILSKYNNEALKKYLQNSITKRNIKKN